MSPKSKEIIRRAMSNAKGDDLERANRAFGNLPKEKLNTEYGASGKTIRELWDTWKQGRAEWEAANKELENLIGP